MSNETHVMIDLETMGKGANAAVISIGLVRFTLEKIIDKAEVCIDLQTCMDKGFTLDASTIEWWLGQSGAARNAYLTAKKYDITTALAHIKKHIGPDDLVWGNGAVFDNAILANAYKRCGFDIPWKYYNDRCYRTLKNLYPEVKPKEDTSLIAHRALDDALYQARHLVRILKHIEARG